MFCRMTLCSLSKVVCKLKSILVAFFVDCLHTYLRPLREFHKYIVILCPSLSPSSGVANNLPVTTLGVYPLALLFLGFMNFVYSIDFSPSSQHPRLYSHHQEQQSKHIQSLLHWLSGVGYPLNLTPNVQEITNLKDNLKLFCLEERSSTRDLLTFRFIYTCTVISFHQYLVLLSGGHFLCKRELSTSCCPYCRFITTV